MTGQATSKTTTETREIKLAHSPDSDDASCFRAGDAQAEHSRIQVTHVPRRYSDLNEAALIEKYDRDGAEFAAYRAARQIYLARLRRQLWRKLRANP